MVEAVTTLSAAGVTAIEATTAGFTCTGGVVADLPWEAAVSVAEPVPVPVASPCVSTVYTAGSELVHATVEERFCVLPSEKVPVAVNCSVVPFAKLGGTEGVMAIETRVEALVVALKLLVCPSTVTVTLLVPGATPVITPLLFTVTAAGFDEENTALLVRFCVEPSEKVPVTVTCALVPAATLGLLGLKETETRVAGVTWKLDVDALLLPKAALIWAAPTPLPVARPLALIDATVRLELDQVADDDRSCVLPSEKVPMAVNC
jgi:hypothetical protein